MYYSVLGTIVVALLTSTLVIITFSNQSYSNKIFSFPVIKKLGKFGFIVFLNNIYFRTVLLQGNYGFTYKKYFIIYLSLTITSSVMSYFIVPILAKLFNIIILKIKKYF